MAWESGEDIAVCDELRPVRGLQAKFEQQQEEDFKKFRHKEDVAKLPEYVGVCFEDDGQTWQVGCVLARRYSDESLDTRVRAPRRSRAADALDCLMLLTLDGPDLVMLVAC